MTARTIIVTGARAPVALHLARLFHAEGHRVLLADSLRWPLGRATRQKSGYLRLPPPRASFEAFAKAWAGIVERHRPDLVVPTCEEVFHTAAVRDIASVPIPLFAPALDHLAAVHDKYSFTELATGIGLDPPRTIRLSSAADVAKLDRDDLVLKPVWSRFGSATLLRPDRAARARLTPTMEQPWVAQQWLGGEEICASAVAIDGRVKALQVYRPLWRAGLGAAIAFAPCEDGSISTFVRTFCERLGWTGQIAFDFRRDSQGVARPIECNPRSTSGLHFFERNDRLAAAMLGSGEARATSLRPQCLPLAFWIYGLGQALRERRLGAWCGDLSQVSDLAAASGDGRLFGGQLLALVEVAARALRHRQGLRAAATGDIEWNGEPFLWAGSLRRP